jgi:hypothetical protein
VEDPHSCLGFGDAKPDVVGFRVFMINLAPLMTTQAVFVGNFMQKLFRLFSAACFLLKDMIIMTAKA